MVFTERGSTKYLRQIEAIRKSTRHKVKKGDYPEVIDQKKRYWIDHIGQPYAYGPACIKNLEEFVINEIQWFGYMPYQIWVD